MGAAMDNPRRKPVHPAIDEAMIHALVHGFYAKIRQDSVLGPVFNPVIGEDWEPHLAKMCDFWSSVMLLSGRYKGNPMAVHMRLTAVRPEHFRHWLRLFGETADELFAPPIAALFKARADMIARSLELGMFYRPGNGRAQGLPENPAG
jgi:hemoglobin